MLKTFPGSELSPLELLASQTDNYSYNFADNTYLNAYMDPIETFNFLCLELSKILVSHKKKSTKEFNFLKSRYEKTMKNASATLDEKNAARKRRLARTDKIVNNMFNMLNCYSKTRIGAVRNPDTVLEFDPQVELCVNEKPPIP